IRWPAGGIEPFRDEETLVSSIDIAPTISEACGAPQTKMMQGLSLLDVCRGGPLGRDTLFGEIFAHDQADLDSPAESLLSRWCIEKETKLILPEEGGPELYAIVDDPFEKQNLAAEQPETVQRLQGLIDAWWGPSRAP